MAGKQPAFPEEEMAVDEGLGYPKAYARLCGNRTVLFPYNHGPPFDFTPYALQPQEALRLKDFNHMFPVIDPEAAPSVNPRGYVNLLWKQLDHLGNAGFDPTQFRVDPYGNVLYLHADSASPLAWGIDHWFPCSRGGKTVPSNLRLLQWQVCDKKRNKLEFLIPWWDLQLGISVNQFLSIFASKNSDFRSRAFSFLFPSGRSEELNPLQAVDSHRFPRHFIESKRQVGLAPAAIVSSRRSSDASVLKSINAQSSIRPSSPLIAARKISGEEGDHGQSMAIQSFRANLSKENSNPNTVIYDGNPYLSISMARDSLRRREETKKKHTELSSLEDELNQLKHSNEEDRVAIQELEALLMKKRRRAEKCRRLAEAQSSYKALLEKMIRDAMHQSVVYKEQARLNQAATSALMARLEAQRAMCDSSETELRRKFKERDEIEKQIRPIWELRKRSRFDDTLLEEVQNGSWKLLSSRTRHPMKKELRRFLEEEQKDFEAGLPLGEGADEETEETTTSSSSAEKETGNSLHCYHDGFPSDEKYRSLAIKTQHCGKFCTAVPLNLEEEQTNEKLKLSATATEEGECSKATQSKMHTVSLQGRIKGEEGSKRSEVRKDKGLIHDESKESAKRENRITTPALPKLRRPMLQQKDSIEEDDERKNQIGKDNLDKWLQIMLKEEKNDTDRSTVEGPCKKNFIPQEVKFLSLKPLEEKGVSDQCLDNKKPKDGKHDEGRRNESAAMNNSILPEKTNAVYGVGRKSFEVKERGEVKPMLRRSDSARGFRSLPSSPSMILRRGGADWTCKKPQVTGDAEEELENSVSASNNSNFIKTCTKAIKKVVNI